MSKVIENYILSDVVGSGQYGKVYKAKNMKNDSVVAIKVVKLEKFREVPKLHEFTINEIQTLSKIENVNIVRFIEMLKTQNNMYLIYDFCNGDTLESLIQKRKFLSEPETMKIFAQLMNAFKSLVKENILHRDLKPSNILFHDGIVKVADFGFCKSLLNNTDLTQTMVGSPIYMAPEVLKGQSYNSKADVWSMGVVLYECLFGFCPYEDKSIARLIMQIDNKELQFPKHINQISRKCEDLLRSMLQVEPRRRVDWIQLMQITFYEEAPAKPVQQILKKQSSTTLTHQSNQPLHPTNILQDRTNIPEQQQYSQPPNQSLRVLLKERNKVIFITQLVSVMLEQNTASPNQPQNQQLNFSQKAIILSFLLMKQACIQSDQIKKYQQEPDYSSKNDFGHSNEFKTFQSTFSREADSLFINLEAFKSELQKTIRYMQTSELVSQVRNELTSNSKAIDMRLFISMIVSYTEEQLERIQSQSEEIQHKMITSLLDLIEVPQLNEFFDKNMDLNTRFTEQKYFDQLRRVSKEALTEMLSQKLVSARIRLSK